jgi:signal peptidase I
MTRNYTSFNIRGLCIIGLAAALGFSIQQQAGAQQSLGECSSFDLDQYTVNGSSELWKVASESMSPLLTPGDMVVVEKSAGFLDVQIGDIIVFKEPIPIGEESGAIISRVTEILNDPTDQLVLITKGDANSGSITGVDFPIYEKDFIGVVDCFMEVLE